MQTPLTVTVQSGDTRRTIAQRVWGDSNLWYLLAIENGFEQPDTALPAGLTIRVPNSVVSLGNSASVFKLFDAGAAIGNTSPEQIVPFIPPPQGKKGCGIIGKILIVVVTIVVTAFTVGAILGAPQGSGIGGIFAEGARALTGKLGFKVGVLVPSSPAVQPEALSRKASRSQRDCRTASTGRVWRSVPSPPE